MLCPFLNPEEVGDEPLPIGRNHSPTSWTHHLVFS